MIIIKIIATPWGCDSSRLLFVCVCGVCHVGIKFESREASSRSLFSARSIGSSWARANVKLTRKFFLSGTREHSACARSLGLRVCHCQIARKLYY